MCGNTVIHHLEFEQKKIYRNAMQNAFVRDFSSAYWPLRAPEFHESAQLLLNFLIVILGCDSQPESLWSYLHLKLL